MFRVHLDWILYISGDRDPVIKRELFMKGLVVASRCPATPTGPPLLSSCCDDNNKPDLTEKTPTFWVHLEWIWYISGDRDSVFSRCPVTATGPHLLSCQACQATIISQI